MEILIAINKILDLKIVQWGLVALVIIMLVGNIVFTLKYNGLRLENALLKADNAKTNAALQIQNDTIKKNGEEYKLKEENLKQANKQAAKVALESQANLKRVLDIQWEGSCDDKVKTIFAIISANRRK